MKLVSTNYLGISIAAIAVVNLIILLNVSLDYARVDHALCGSPTCTLANHIPVQSYVGFSLLIASAGTGGYLAFQRPRAESQIIPKAKLNKIVAGLEGDEKKIFDELAKNEGLIFQNDLIAKTKYSKVKISRLLDRLEMKGVVERRRRGMANVVVLKV